MQSEKKASRLVWMDVAKGVAMLLVLIGHCMRDEMRTDSAALDMLYRGIYGFHMSWFFWISGYSYRLSRKKGRAPLSIVGRRLKSQFPYWIGYTLFIFLAFSAAIAIPQLGGILESAGYTRLSIGSYLLSAVQANNPWAYHLWFLLILILLTAIVGLADALFGGKCTKAVCAGLIVLGLVGLALRDTVHVGDWWRVYDYLTLYLPLFCIGVLMADWKVPNALIWIWGALGVAFIVVRTAFFSGFSGNSLRVSGWQRFAVYLCADLLLPGVMVMLGHIFEKGWFPRTKPVKKFIDFLGRESLAIYLWHQPFCCAFLGMLLYGKLHVPAPVTMAICFAASLLVSWAFVLVRDCLKKAFAKKKAA